MPWPGLKWPRGRFGKREGPRLQRSEVRRQMSDGRWGQRDHGTTGQRDNKTRTEDGGQMESERRTPNAQRPTPNDGRLIEERCQKSDPPKDGFAVAKVRGQSHAATSSAGEDRKRTTRPRDNRTT